MTLRTLIASLDAAGSVAFANKLPKTPTTSKVASNFGSKYALGGTIRLPPDLNEIADNLRYCLQNKREIERRWLKVAPNCLWLGDKKIADDERLLKLLLDEIEATGRKSTIRRLASEYFRQFDADHPSIHLIGATLERTIDEKFGKLSEMSRVFSAFDPNIGPKKIARICVEHDAPPHTILTDYGLSRDMLIRGFGNDVYQRAMKGLQGLIQDKPTKVNIQKAMDWTDGVGDLEYESAGPTLAKTLLLPFQSQDPDSELKNRLIDEFLGRVGDPRTKPSHWVQMQNAATVLKRWLTQLALKQFLEIVDEVAYQGHWAYRRAFWMSLYDKGLIDDAWVAFGPRGASRARQVFGQNTAFARLYQDGYKPVEAGHAVLIMRLADLTVVDWSHNGRCIVWQNSDPKCPKLFSPTYGSKSLAPRLPPPGGLEQTHSSPSTYSWQRSVAEFLGRKLGVQVHQRDYMVRRR